MIKIRRGREGEGGGGLGGGKGGGASMSTFVGLSVEKISSSLLVII